MRFLLLDGVEESYWKAALAEALTPLGTLYSAPAAEGVPAEEPDGLIIIDAAAPVKVEQLIAKLRAERPARRIVVMTASPTWQRARAAFEAGAVDYLPKTMPPAELLDTIRQLLARPAPQP